MKYVTAIASIFLAISLLYAQETWEDINQIPSKYQIDGSLSVREVTDTAQMKNVVNHQRFTIKKSERFTYIGIRSNTSSMLNAYLVDKNQIAVFHASASLGQVNFQKKDNQYKPEKSEFDWIYRDPEVWDEKHPNGVDSLEDFYTRFGWTANTWNYGSYREVEMIIDNKHFTSETRLIISYTSIEDGEYAVRFKEGKDDVSITGDADTDIQLHNGYLPESIIFSTVKGN